MDKSTSKPRSTRKRIYSIWYNMKVRCQKKDTPRYKRHAGRGITVCEEWVASFDRFYEWALNNGYADDLTIERIDNDGNYEPGNCRWATWKEQSRNRKNTVILTAFGETKLLLDWINDPRCVVSYSRVTQRLELGLPHEVCMSTPVNEGCFSLKKRPRCGKTRAWLTAAELLSTMNKPEDSK